MQNSSQVEGSSAIDAVVEAAGPTTVTFAPGRASTQRTGVLEAAGAYLLHATLGGAPVSGWPRVLHVLPAPADPARYLPPMKAHLGDRLRPEGLAARDAGRRARLWLAARASCAHGARRPRKGPTLFAKHTH